MNAFTCMYFYDHSLNEFQRRMEEGQHKNNLKTKQEKIKIDNTKETKYALIEAICKKYEFENQEELIKKIEELSQIPVDILSTGPDRDETLILKNPFE